MVDGLKNIGVFIIGAGFLVLLLLISVWMIQGAVWVGEHIMQWLINLAWIAFGINFFILLPLSLFGKTKMFGGIGMFISSYVFGLTLWFLGLLITYFTWGFLGVFIGLILGGIGVIPVAMLATLLVGELFVLFVLILLSILTFGLKILGVYMISKAEETNDEYARHNINMLDYEQES
jgi:hypothetical protein